MSTKYVLAIEPSESEPERLYYAGPKRNVERIADRVAYSPRDATKFETAAEADELRERLAARPYGVVALKE